ncbi:MAG: hypothetical protein ACJ789_01195 [Thermomicrobiales bacterium]
MNGQLFDDLARSLVKPANHRSSRRALLRSVGLGGAAGLAASILGRETATAAFQDATPPPVPKPEPVDPPINIVSVAQKAFELGLDADAIFRYVADEVRYEAYSGALRGETGTLWSMAGNSVDQALLLAALLREALVEVRFAIGTLDNATAQQLVDSMVVDADTFRALDQRAQIANLSVNGTSVLDAPAGEGTTPVLTPEQRQALDGAAKAREALIAEGDRQVSESLNLITDALASKNITLPDPAAPTLPERERQQHVWVQYAAGTEWIDLDPSFPNADAGKIFGTAVETVDQLPADLDHVVRFRLDKESVSGGAPHRETILTMERNARDLVGVPIVFTHIDPAIMKELGSEIEGLIEGGVNYVPIFIAGEEAESADRWLQFDSGGGILGDGLGGETSNEGDTLAEWLITEIVTPDGALEPIERVIFDRVGFEKRAEAAADGIQIDLTTVPLIDPVDMGEAGSKYPPMLSFHSLAVVGSQVPPWLFDPSRLTSNFLSALSIGQHGYHMLRDRLSVDLGLAQGHRFYADAPNVTAHRMEPINITSGQIPEFSIEADLIHRSVVALPVEEATAEAHAGVLAGVLAHVAERMSLDSTSWARDFAAESLPAATSVGRVFEEAGKQHIATTVLLPETADADVATLDISPQAAARMREALAAGQVIIVPEKAVQIDGVPVTGWWQIDPATGKTLDRMENGRGNVALRSKLLDVPMASEATTILNVTVRAAWTMKEVGCAVAVGVATAAFIFEIFFAVTENYLAALLTGLALPGAGGVIGSCVG